MPLFSIKINNSDGSLDFLSRDFIFNLVLPYLIGFLLVLTTNTLPGMSLRVDSVLLLAVVFVCLIVTAYAWILIPIDLNALGRWICWALLLLTTYCLVAIGSHSNSIRGFASILIFVIMPLVFIVVRKAGAQDRYITAFVDIMSIIAVISIAVWILGPVFHLIEPNCTIISAWSGNGRIRNVVGYFNLSYNTQWQNLPTGAGVYRNTSIFAEAPMYSYALCCALIAEIYFRDQVLRFNRCIVLTIAILTTFSSTGIIFLLGIGLSLALGRVHSAEKNVRIFLSLLLVILFIFFSILALIVLDNKLQSSSGSTRLDDFVAGYRAWSHSPIFGYGFDNADVVKKYMSAFRADNLGFSSGLFQILVLGGLVLLMPYVISFYGLFRTAISRSWIVVLLLMFLMVITVVPFLPLSFFMLSFGVSYLLDRVEYAVDL